jgi:hypothetical protein
MTSNQKPNEDPVPPKSTGAKRKTKYYNLYSKDGKENESVMLKGRVKCDCQAQKHQLIANCLTCGRIVCEQEGSGPCLFCTSLVCTESEMKIINSQTRKGDQLKKSLLSTKGLSDALAHRDKLLEYDRQSEQRTTVIDDESDYFKSNSVWLSNEERTKLKALEEDLRSKKHASRREQSVTLDFAGRQVLEESQFSHEIEEKILRQIVEATTGGSQQSSFRADSMNEAPKFDENVPQNFPTLKFTKGFDGVFSRVQDQQFQEMSDQKACLSMHQPWASLLVANIKRDEGRNWYSGHRGRLWIASTVRVPDSLAIKEIENFYRAFYNDPDIKFPTQYPSGVLLGCVDVVECLPQEEYRKKYPKGESDSAFIFVCKNPQELPIRFPIRGEPKICECCICFIVEKASF